MGMAITSVTRTPTASVRKKACLLRRLSSQWKPANAPSASANMAAISG